MRELKVFAFTEVGGNGVYWVSEAKMGLDVRRKVEGFRTRAILKPLIWEFPGGPVVRTPHFECQGPEFNPWSGN